MLEITREEKELLQVAFPEEQFVRTAKGKGNNRGQYFCTERPAVRNALKKIRSEKSAKSGKDIC